MEALKAEGNTVVTRLREWARRELQGTMIRANDAVQHRSWHLLAKLSSALLAHVTCRCGPAPGESLACLTDVNASRASPGAARQEREAPFRKLGVCVGYTPKT
jgi:hypothetical protein